MDGLLAQLIVMDNADEGLDGMDLDSGSIARALAGSATKQVDQGWNPICCLDPGKQLRGIRPQQEPVHSLHPALSLRRV